MRLLIHRFTWLCAAGSLIFTADLRAQVLDAPVKGYQYSEFDPVTRKRKFLLSGESVTNVSNVELALAGTRLEIFDAEGRTNLIVMSPQCRYHTRDKRISSCDKLQVTTGDGQFSIEGEGFEWTQDDTRLTISNRVHAVIRKDLVGAQPAASAASVPPPPPTIPAPVPAQLIHIFSDRFQSRTNRAVFQDNVRVDEAQGTLTCGVLTAAFSDPDRKIETILAERSVVIESAEVRATGEKATYRIQDEVVVLEENPTWRIGQREGRAQELVLNRKTRAFRASRDVQMKLPPGSLGKGGFLPQSRVATTPAPATGQPIEVSAGDFQFTPDPAETNLNLAVFTGDVRVRDERGRLRCESMTIRSAIESGRTESLVAERNVVVEQEGNHVTGEKAVYTAATESIEMTGDPAWKLGEREGRARVLVFDLTNKTYRATGDVRMRLPPGALGSSAWLLPRTSKRSGASAPPVNSVPVPPARSIEISSDEFEFNSAPSDGGTDTAIYHGKVHVSDPGRMTLTCQTLTGSIAGTNRVESIVADRNVEIRIVNPGGDRVARGDRAVYTAGRDEVQLTGTDGVEIVLADTAGESRARGREAVYTGAEDVLELTGEPVLTTPRGQVTGEHVIWKRSDSTVKATGYWKMQVRVQAFEKPVQRPSEK